MIKLSNQQAALLISPLGRSLLNKTFPVKESFLISDVVKSIDQRIESYRISFKKIVEKHNGEILKDGQITYKTDKDKDNALEEIKALNDINLEYPGELLKITDDWPKLTPNEATILSPLISRE